MQKKNRLLHAVYNKILLITLKYRDIFTLEFDSRKFRAIFITFASRKNMMTQQIQNHGFSLA